MMTNDTPIDTGGPQDLAQIMAQMISQINDMQAEQASEREAMQVQIQALQENVASLQATPVAIPQSLTPLALPIVAVILLSPPSQTKKKMTLLDPPCFDRNWKKYQNQRLEIEGKLYTNSCLLRSPTDQFIYIYSQLRDTPQSIAAIFYKSSSLGSTYNPLSFLKYLSTIYKDSNIA